MDGERRHNHGAITRSAVGPSAAAKSDSASSNGARSGGAEADDVASVWALLLSADHASDRLHALQQRAIRLIPDFLRSPRWVPVVGWLMVIGALLSVVFGLLGVALGGYLYEDEKITLKLDPLSVALPLRPGGTGRGVRGSRRAAAHGDDRELRRTTRYRPPGVHTYGTAGNGRVEYYGVRRSRRITAIDGHYRGVPLGGLAACGRR